MSDPRLCLALDGTAAADPEGWVARTRHVFGVYKIGLELFCARGPSVVEACRAAGAEQIFLDLKLHDIPQTVARAIQSLAPLNIDYLTLHLGGGSPMLEAARARADGIRLLGVTVLTSLGEGELQTVGVGPLAETVARRTQLAQRADLFGVVCSPLEAAQVAAQGVAAITPGIRWADAQADDQTRVSDPTAALAAGSSMLVIGRMVTAAVDPAAAMERLQGACQ